MGNGSPRASTKDGALASVEGVRTPTTRRTVQWGASPELGACNTRAPSDDTGARDVVRFVRGLAIALGVSLLVWAVLGALGFAIYLLVA